MPFPVPPHPAPSHQIPANSPHQPDGNIPLQPHPLPKKDNGAMVMAIYVLYAIGFFFWAAAFFGYILAHIYSQEETGRNRLHFEFQKGIFQVGILFLLLIAATCLAAFLLLTAKSSLLLALLMSICFMSLSLSFYWFIWTIIAIIVGFKASSINDAPSAARILGISPLPGRFRSPPMPPQNKVK